ncbi:hypothetical protein AMJ80_00360 [bacterium SM23_31]|nr:MAG: hypothetical protein AMJ80_00360 [bacterium SM23_31]
MKYSPDKPDIIRICNMSFFGHHGPWTNERKIGNHYQADINIYLDTRKAAKSDSIRKTIDYSGIFDIAQEVIERNSYKLLETIAEKIARKILEMFDIISVDVTIRKLKPSLRGVVDFVEITISRKKKK